MTRNTNAVDEKTEIEIERMVEKYDDLLKGVVDSITPPDHLSSRRAALELFAGEIEVSDVEWSEGAVEPEIDPWFLGKYVSYAQNDDPWMAPGALHTVAALDAAGVDDIDHIRWLAAGVARIHLRDVVIPRDVNTAYRVYTDAEKLYYPQGGDGQ
jgi:DNA replicative helicase MCM subunit Mcm2 (Cdc46/Mcm family)